MWGRRVIASGWQHYHRRTVAAASAAMVVTTTTSLLHCEQQQQKEEQEDPYQHLTDDDDEPTECTICKTNRQGPCRNEWRKFERCMKDNSSSSSNNSSGSSSNEDTDNANESSSNVGEACDKYMLPWLECIQGYRNLYTVISNNVAANEYVNPYVEELVLLQQQDNNAVVVEQKQWNINAQQEVDWSDAIMEYQQNPNIIQLDEYWKKLLQTALAVFPTLNEYLEHTGQQPVVAVDEEFRPNTMIAGDDDDIALVEVRVRVSWSNDNSSSSPEEEEEIMDVCFAQDQNGQLLGMDRFAPKEEDDDNNVPPPKEGMLRLYVQPGKTMSITLTKITKTTKKDAKIDDTSKTNTANTEEEDDAVSTPAATTTTMHVSKPIWIPEVLYQYQQQQQEEEQQLQQQDAN